MTHLRVNEAVIRKAADALIRHTNATNAANMLRISRPTLVSVAGSTAARLGTLLSVRDAMLVLYERAVDRSLADILEPVARAHGSPVVTSREDTSSEPPAA